MAKSWTCRHCGRRNGGDRDACVDCEAGRPEPTKRETTATRPAVCQVDGGPVDAKGFCSVAQAYVSAAACPFACPHCRRLLTWAGDCFACRPSEIPGDRYETEGGHYRRVETGPRRLCTPAQNREALSIVMAISSGELTAAAGRELLALNGITQ